MSSQRLSSEDRFLIARNFAGSKSVRAIARLHGRAASTVSRALGRLSNRPATTVAKAICSLLKGHMVRVRSSTADHGQEFAAHGARSRKINAPFFFADRYRFWQR